MLGKFPGMFFSKTIEKLIERGGETMARKKNNLNEVRSALYRSAQVIGDIEAASRGPEAVARRVVRRLLGRATGRALRKLFR